jgi:hypothetical protein
VAQTFFPQEHVLLVFIFRRAPVLKFSATVHKYMSTKLCQHNVLVLIGLEHRLSRVRKIRLFSLFMGPRTWVDGRLRQDH